MMSNALDDGAVDGVSTVGSSGEIRTFLRDGPAALAVSSGVLIDLIRDPGVMKRGLMSSLRCVSCSCVCRGAVPSLE